MTRPPPAVPLTAVAQFRDSHRGLAFSYPANWQVKPESFEGEDALLVAPPNDPHAQMRMKLIRKPQSRCETDNLLRMHRGILGRMSSGPDFALVESVEPSPESPLNCTFAYTLHTGEGRIFSRIWMMPLHPCGVLFVQLSCNAALLDQYADHIKLVRDSIRVFTPEQPQHGPLNIDVSGDPARRAPIEGYLTAEELLKRGIKIPGMEHLNQPPRLLYTPDPDIPEDRIITFTDISRNILVDHPASWAVMEVPALCALHFCARMPTQTSPQVTIRLQPAPSPNRDLIDIGRDTIAAMGRNPGARLIEDVSACDHHGLPACWFSFSLRLPFGQTINHMRFVKIDAANYALIVAMSMEEDDRCFRSQLLDVVASVRPHL